MKVLKRFVCVCLALCAALVLFAPVFPAELAFAEEEQEVFYLVDPTSSAEPDDVYNTYHVYNGKISSKNPFDTREGSLEGRLPGWSFSLNTEDKEQINNQYVSTNKFELDTDKNYSLFIWTYFSQTLVHGLNITLEFENGAQIYWNFSQNELQELLSKYASSETEVLPYAWNRLELPFAAAYSNGVVYANGNKIYPITKIIFNYSSPTILPSGLYASLRFYGPYISTATDGNYNVIKQNYRYYKFNFEQEDIAESLVLGDKLKIKTRQQAITYAYEGDNDLLAGGYTWRVVLKTPDEENEFLYPSFGEEITFDKEGTYTLYYQCIDPSQSSTRAIISGSQNYVIAQLRGVYFDKDSYKIKVGEENFISVNTSRKLSNKTDITLVDVPEGVEVRILNNGLISVTANKEGTYTIKVGVSGTRAAKPELSQYEGELTITATKDKDDARVFRIVLWSALGVIGAVFIVASIILLVKAHKIDVK